MAASSQPGDAISIRPTAAAHGPIKPTVLIKADHVRVVRFMFSAGDELAEHTTPGDLVVQCLQGEVDFTAQGRTQTLRPDQLLYLPAKVPHSVKALDDSLLLLTIVIPPKRDG